MKLWWDYLREWAPLAATALYFLFRKFFRSRAELSDGRIDENSDAITELQKFLPRAKQVDKLEERVKELEADDMAIDDIDRRVIKLELFETRIEGWRAEMIANINRKFDEFSWKQKELGDVQQSTRTLVVESKKELTQDMIGLDGKIDVIISAIAKQDTVFARIDEWRGNTNKEVDGLRLSRDEHAQQIQTLITKDAIRDQKK